MLPRQVVHIGEYRLSLPEGVSVLDWALERIHYQNPRIRAFLGSLRLIQGTLESNYSILHCSPERLHDIWRKVRKTSLLIRTEIGPLLAAPSRIPRLEEARQGAELSLGMVDRHVLRPLDRFPAEVTPHELPELRKLLCVTIGQLHAFLQDTFGEFMASDPRSLHDADYFLSKRFPQDIEEAEWLHASVDRLQDYLERLEPARGRYLSALALRLRDAPAVPRGRLWEDTLVLLDVLVAGLTPKLKEVLALRGVRFYEIEILDRYAAEIPARCRTLVELHEAAAATVDGIESVAGDSADESDQSAHDLLQVHAIFSARMASLLEELDRSLEDLITFVPIWLDNIEKRRALLLRRSVEMAGQSA
jgi:hypothetical protein